MESGLLYKYIL